MPGAGDKQTKRQGAFMDPDMVRQQEEAETAIHRRGAPSMRAATPETQQPQRPAEPSFVLRAEPREDIAAKPAPEPPARKAPPGWGAAFRATGYGFLLTSAGYFGGIMLGIKFGLPPWQSLAIGAGLGYAFGWQSAFVTLRRRYDISLARALGAPIVPTAIIVFALVSGMATASLYSRISPASLSSELTASYWITLGLFALGGFLFAAERMRGGLRK
jgi:hypothetical protein